MINKYFYAFIAYCTSIWCVDFIYEILNIHSTLLNVCLSIGMIPFVVLFFQRHREYFYHDDFKVADFVVMALLAIIYFSHVHLPDTGWDVISYHLLHQEHLPWSQVYESFFPSSILHSFLYPLGDRMQYPFRMMLGFRLGTLLNFLICLLVYIQLRQILMGILKIGKKEVVSIGAFFATITISSINQINTYYVDMITVPIILFFMNEFLHGDTYSKSKLLLMSWCISLEICLKLSAGIPLIIMIAYFAVEERRNIKITLCLASLFLSALALVPYGYRTYLETQSPLFPFMNQMFSSKLFLFPEDAQKIFGGILKEGPQNLWESLILPISVLCKFSKMMRYDQAVLLILGIAGCIYMVWKWKVKSDIDKRIVMLFGLFYVLWIVVYHCFNRYNPGLEIMTSLIIVTIAWRLWMERRCLFSKLLAYGLILVIIADMGVFLGWKLWKSNPVYRYDDFRNANVNMILKDREITTDNFNLKKVKSWLAVSLQPSQGYDYLLKPAPIVCLDGYAPAGTVDYSVYVYQKGKAAKIYNSLMNKYENNGMYCILQTQGHIPAEENRETIMAMVLDRLMQSGYVVKDITAITPEFVREGRNISIGEVRRQKRDCTFTEYVINPQETKHIKHNYNGQADYDMYIALFPDKKSYGTVPQKPFAVVVKIYDENNEVVEINRYSSQGEYVNVRMTTKNRIEITYDNLSNIDIPLLILCYEATV